MKHIALDEFTKLKLEVCAMDKKSVQLEHTLLISALRMHKQSIKVLFPHRHLSTQIAQQLKQHLYYARAIQKQQSFLRANENHK
ncbi:hypothetical protein LS71_002630 [Helicobacter jaachi]|uniref:Uncharacterized protein n=1 Tax=Helicobacter jaachi TaxID=1677920 RepID=A0A4U8TDB3_9HELI|nr:hypothetical protein [Helicobacter jaachi]TLD97654.1 hypothetical protein LS71_002630 [Helicobacter jaachi]